MARNELLLINVEQFEKFIYKQNRGSKLNDIITKFVRVNLY